MIFRIFAVLIYIMPLALLASLLYENGFNISINYYSTIYGHLFYFPIIFFPLILFLIKKPSVAIFELFENEIFKNKKARKKHLGIYFALLTVFSSSIFVVDIFKPYYAPWEVSLNSKALDMARSYDDNNLFLNHIKKLDSENHKNTPWINNKEWPNIFLYLLKAGEISTKMQISKKNGWEKYSDQHAKDRKTLSNILSTKNETGYYTKSLAGWVYYASIFSIIFLSMSCLMIAVLYLLVHLNISDKNSGLIKKYNLKENFLKITIIVVCFVFWFVIRFTFLDVQNRFLEGVSKDQEVGPLLLFVTATVVACVFWFIKYKEILKGVLSAIASLIGLFVVFIHPDFLTDIFTSISTYIVMVVFMLLLFSFMYFNEVIKKSIMK